MQEEIGTIPSAAVAAIPGKTEFKLDDGSR